MSIAEPEQSTERTVHVSRFSVKQQLTLMVNRFQILATNDDGTEELMAFASQKRLRIKEEVNFFRDESMSDKLFSMKSRKAWDGSRTDILDSRGAQMGWFQRDWVTSLARTTWHLRYGATQAVGKERSLGVALARRFLDTPLAYHFDFVNTETSDPVLSVTRARSMRDVYLVEAIDRNLDHRVAASMAVALDVFQCR